MASILAYYDTATIMSVKSFIFQGPSVGGDDKVENFDTRDQFYKTFFFATCQWA
jgi:hypothetical protein